MLLTSVITAAQETHESGAALSPYAVGAIALVILLALLVAVLAFGKGREHS
ncbi:hypothetical protein [Nocardioides pakistanensis]